MLSQNELKQQVAKAAVEYIRPFLGSGVVVGVGTGSTADLFIDHLAGFKAQFKAAAASSERSAQRLAGLGIPVLDLNEVQGMPVYVDGADEINARLQMIKGGGGALTREKIVASVAEQFVCIADESKVVDRLGKFSIPLEVIPMAVNAVARKIQALGGNPVLRAGFVTDNGNPILDVAGFSLDDAADMEAIMNNVPGVVTCGLFAISPASVALIATQQGIRTMKA
ncbi:ribose-5-phosphate isomerase RpiA [Advenella sp. WQ 585]|uniref:Ribose-5-phosphate isomerase A n=1 Tax=Advenella mandrilli TaxID=2800330 RepID=A0ABS1EEE2_9BURK|nr:ribose-5-phosphate isomerase RpiA [Advenella mandrilli]MBK1779890.1 ribose-5-phosphate isomerase RpiA [Advenella mandrilli]